MLIGLFWHSTYLLLLGQMLLIFEMSFDGIKHSAGLLYKIKFYLFIVRRFFLLIHFLVVEDHESPKSTCHVLHVPLTLECVRILS